MSSYEITLCGDQVPAGRVHAVVGQLLAANAHAWQVEVEERSGVAARAKLVARSYPSRAVDVWLAVDLVDAITAVTGWQAFDPQKRLALADHAHPWRAPRVWDGIRGPLVPGARESGRRVEQIAFVGDSHIAAAFYDGRICIYDRATLRPVATLGLFPAGHWIALAPDGTWDGTSGLAEVQWQWPTDMRTYRDIVQLDPAKRQRGWLVEALGLS